MWVKVCCNLLTTYWLTEPGNFVYPQDLITAEIAHALLSCCLPSIFSLVRHLFRVYVPSSSATLSRSDRMSTPVQFRLGHVNNPIESKNHKGSIEIEIRKSVTGGSEEGLILNTREKVRTIT